MILFLLFSVLFSQWKKKFLPRFYKKISSSFLPVCCFGMTWNQTAWVKAWLLPFIICP